MIHWGVEGNELNVYDSGELIQTFGADEPEEIMALAVLLANGPVTVENEDGLEADIVDIYDRARLIRDSMQVILSRRS